MKYSITRKPISTSTSTLLMAAFIVVGSVALLFQITFESVADAAEDRADVYSRVDLLEVDRRMFLEQKADAGSSARVAHSSVVEGASLVDHLRLVMGQPISRAVISGDGRYCAVVPLASDHDASGFEVLVYDLVEPARAARRFGLTDRPTALALSHFGARLLVGTERGQVIAWDVISGEKTSDPTVGTNHAIAEIASSPGGSYAALASGEVLILDIENGDLLRCASRLTSIRHIALSGNGRLLAVSQRGAHDDPRGTQPMCEVVSLAVGEVYPVDNGSTYARDLAFAPGRLELVMVDQGGQVRMWDAVHGSTQRLRGVEAGTNPLVISPDGSRMASIFSGQRSQPRQSTALIHDVIQINAGRLWDKTALHLWQLGDVVAMQFLDNQHLIAVTRRGQLFVVPLSYPDIAPESFAAFADDAVQYGPAALEDAAREFLGKPLKKLSQDEAGDLMVLLASRKLVTDPGDPLSERMPRHRREVIDVLMSYGAGINHRAGTARWTAMHWAAFTDDVELAGFLMELGADFAIADAQGRPMMEVAAAAGSERVLKMFDIFD